MFSKDYKTSFYLFYLFLLSIYVFYIFIPYVLNFTGYANHIILNHFSSNSHEAERFYIGHITDKINFNYFFLINTFSFFIISILFLILIKKNRITNNFDKLFIKASQSIILISLIFLFLDFYDYYYHYINILSESTEDKAFLDRNSFYNFFNGRRQTHYIVGSIFSIFCLKNNKFIIPIIFLSLISFIEIISLSRFYIFLIFASLLILSNKKAFLLLGIVIVTIIFYRFILLDNTMITLIKNFLFEPISINFDAIIKLSNAQIELTKIDIFEDLILKNIFTNFLFFDYSNSYYIFEEKYHPQIRSFAQFGLLDILAYPLQILFISILLYLLKKILEKFYDFTDLYIITGVFCSFMIIRGSAIYGLSFMIKMQIIFIIISLCCFLIKKFDII
tara:strand:+ start:1361 stop:2533 length:1173 start_codon:yes stop_codon:yes gene_type:complete